MIYYEVYDRKSDEWIRVDVEDITMDRWMMSNAGKVIWVDKPQYIRIVEESDA